MKTKIIVLLVKKNLPGKARTKEPNMTATGNPTCKRSFARVKINHYENDMHLLSASKDLSVEIFAKLYYWVAKTSVRKEKKS